MKKMADGYTPTQNFIPLALYYSVALVSYQKQIFFKSSFTISLPLQVSCVLYSSATKNCQDIAAAGAASCSV